MNLLDPKRPLVDSYWQRLIVDGRAVGAVPTPYIYTEKRGFEVVHRIRVNINLKGGFETYETIIQAGKLDDFFQRWINDTEGTLEKDFKVRWDGRTESIKINPVGRPLKEPPKAMALDELFA